MALRHVEGSSLRPLRGPNVAVDPGFVGGGGYRPALGVGAIDRGAGNPGTAPDAVGAPRALDGDLDGAVGPDIGFHEFTDAALAVTVHADAGQHAHLRGRRRQRGRLRPG